MKHQKTQPTAIAPNGSASEMNVNCSLLTPPKKRMPLNRCMSPQLLPLSNSIRSRKVSPQSKASKKQELEVLSEAWYS